MLKRRKLLKRLSEGALKNVRFEDFTDLVAGFSFRLVRVRGSHHIFTHPAIPELVNLQEVRGKRRSQTVSGSPVLAPSGAV